MLGQPASSHTVCSPPERTSDLSSVYCGPVRALVLIHGGLRSIGVSLLRTSRRRSLRPSGAMVTSPGYAAGPVLHGLHPRGGNADATVAGVDRRIFIEPRRGPLGRVSWILGDGTRDPDRPWQGGGPSRRIGIPGRADNAARGDLGASTAVKIRETRPSQAERKLSRASLTSS